MTDWIKWSGGLADLSRLCRSGGASGNLHAELSRMATDGKIECISGKGRGCAQYRKIQGVAR